MVKRIAFFLPGAARSVRGGHKVLFTYANDLARRGAEVSIFFPATNATNRRGMEMAARVVRYGAGMIRRSIYMPVKWFDLHPAITTRWVWRGRPEHANRFDIGIIADHAVAPDVMGWGAQQLRPDAKTAYVFQEIEYYMTGGASTRAAIERTIVSADAVVAVSPVTFELASRLAGAERVHLVSNGVELETYFVRERGDPAERRGIGFAYREESFKRTADVVAALAALHDRREMSGFRCWAYGAAAAPRLPSWIEYHCRPASEQLAELLNRSAIFVVASLYEGWGLPGAEAMACGAALVTSRNGGCEAYARHEENALVFTPGSSMELTACLVRLIHDRELRHTLAAEGARSIRAHDWDQACAKFCAVIEGLSSRPAARRGCREPA